MTMICIRGAMVALYSLRGHGSAQGGAVLFPTATPGVMGGGKGITYLFPVILFSGDRMSSHWSPAGVDSSLCVSLETSKARPLGASLYPLPPCVCLPDPFTQH